MAIARRLQYLSDAEVVGIAQLGSLEACDELVYRFRNATVLVAMQVLDCRETAHDVAQEAFLLAFRALPNLQEPGKFAGWLHAITRNHARRVGIRNKRQSPTEDAGLEQLLTQQNAPATDGLLEQVLETERENDIRALLSDLPSDIQIVLRLFYYEQWPVARIADFLSLPSTTVKWRLHDGRKRLSPRLAELLDEEKPHVRPQPQQGNTQDTQPAAENGRNSGTRRTDRQLRKRSPQLCETV